MSKQKITGVILAGGKNSRMGMEKGLLEVEGKRIIERIIDELKQVADEILIISNNATYNYLNYKVCADLIQGCGPMSGIHSALKHSRTKKNIVISCDMPFVSKEVIKKLIANSKDCDVSIPKHGGFLEPLCAVYSKSCTKTFEKLLKQSVTSSSPALRTYRDVLDTTRSVSTRTDKTQNAGRSANLKLTDSFRYFIVKRINFTKKELSGKAFLNINTPQEYQRIKQ